MTTHLLIARHAAHDWLGRGFAGRQPQVSLNEQGQREAEALVERLRDVRLDALYCSPQPRTQQTAQPLARERGMAIRIDAAFDEVDLGDWQGRTFDEVRHQPAWKHWCEHRGSAQPPGGERFVDVARRMGEGLRRLAREHPERNVLVVSHGDPIKSAIAGVLGLSLDNLEAFEIAPASISVVAMGEDWAQVRLVNARGAVSL